MTAVSDADFRKAVLQAHKPVLVHFAGSDDASSALGPVLDGLANRLGGRSKVARVELTATAELATRFGVLAPSLIYFRDGSVAGRKPEAWDSEDALYDWLEGMGIGCACHPD